MKVLLTIVLLFFLTVACGQQLSWQNLPMGGGGYVTGMVINLQDSSIQYIRTDVGGAYKWDAIKQQWSAIADMFDINSNGQYFVDGIAVDQNNPNVVWMYTGMDGNPQGIYKSINKGANWTQVKSVQALGDGAKRYWGEPIMVDPNNSSVVYCGTRNNGLLVTSDGGTTWSTVNSVPTGVTNIGIRCVVIDGSSVIGGKSAKIYVGIYGTGIYQSTDGGSTFSLITSSPSTVHRMVIGSNSILYVTHDAGVSKYGTSSSWSNITPSAGAYTAVAVAKDNPNKILVVADKSGIELPIYFSMDGGSTWSANKVTNATVNYQAAWYIPTDRFSAGTVSANFNPQNTNQVYITDAYQVMRCDDITLANTVWNQLLKGHEEMVVLGMASPPHSSSGQSILYAATADNGTFKSVNTTDYPTLVAFSSSEGTDVDYCESFPKYVVTVGASEFSTSSTGKISLSRNGNTFSNSGLAVAGVGGNVAYSSTDSNRIVVAPVVGVPVYSTNKGASWIVSAGATPRNESSTLINKKVLIADKVDGNTFYYYNSPSLFKSTDGGATWRATGFSLIASNVRIKSVFGHAGHLWMAVRIVNAGLYHSTDGGSTFTKFANISTAESVAIGKAASGATYPTVYFYGILNNVVGVYRSTDEGSTWTKINDPNIMMGQEPRVMEADREEFGKIYIGTGGRGIFYSSASSSNVSDSVNFVTDAYYVQYRSPKVVPTVKLSNAQTKNISVD